MTAMKAAFLKAGINPAENEFLAALAKFLGSGGTVERVYELIAKAIPDGSGPIPGAGKATLPLPPIQTHREGKGQVMNAEKAGGEVPAPREPSKAAKAAAKKARLMAADAIWDRTIGGEVKLRGSTRQHWDMITRKGIVMTHVGQRMLTEIDWPDDVTPLEQVASAAQVKAILDSGYGALNKIAVK